LISPPLPYTGLQPPRLEGLLLPFAVLFRCKLFCLLVRVRRERASGLPDFFFPSLFGGESRGGLFDCLSLVPPSRLSFRSSFLRDTGLPCAIPLFSPTLITPVELFVTVKVFFLELVSLVILLSSSLLKRVCRQTCLSRFRFLPCHLSLLSAANYVLFFLWFDFS